MQIFPVRSHDSNLPFLPYNFQTLACDLAPPHGALHPQISVFVKCPVKCPSATSSSIVPTPNQAQIKLAALFPKYSSHVFFFWSLKTASVIHDVTQTHPPFIWSLSLPPRLPSVRPYHLSCNQRSSRHSPWCCQDNLFKTTPGI